MKNKIYLEDKYLKIIFYNLENKGYLNRTKEEENLFNELKSKLKL